jgi:hypothetical protein
MYALFEHNKILFLLLHTSPDRKKIKLDKDLFLHSKHHCFEHCTICVHCVHSFTVQDGGRLERSSHSGFVLFTTD